MGTNRAIVFDWAPELYQQAPRLIDSIIKEELGDFGSYLTNWISEKSPRDTSNAANSINFSVNSFSEGAYLMVVESKVPYAYWALEYGRTAGTKSPGVLNIDGWVSRKNLVSYWQNRSSSGVSGVSTRKKRGRIKISRINPTAVKRSAAFLIMRSIGQKGIQAPKLFLRAIIETREEQELVRRRVVSRILEALNLN